MTVDTPSLTIGNARHGSVNMSEPRLGNLYFFSEHAKHTFQWRIPQILSPKHQLWVSLRCSHRFLLQTRCAITHTRCSITLWLRNKGHQHLSRSSQLQMDLSTAWWFLTSLMDNELLCVQVHMILRPLIDTSFQTSGVIWTSCLACFQCTQLQDVEGTITCTFILWHCHLCGHKPEDQKCPHGERCQNASSKRRIVKNALEPSGHNKNTYVWDAVRENSVLLPKTAKHQESAGKIHEHPVHIWNFWASRRKKALKGPSNPPVASFTRVFRGLLLLGSPVGSGRIFISFHCCQVWISNLHHKNEHSYVFSVHFWTAHQKMAQKKNAWLPSKTEVRAFLMNLWHRQRSDPCEMRSLLGIQGNEPEVIKYLWQVDGSVCLFSFKTYEATCVSVNLRILQIRRPLCLAWGGGVREELQSLILDSTAAVASPCMPLSIHGIHIIHARLRHVCCHLPGAFYFSFNGFKSALSAQCGRVAKATFLACWGSPVS